MQVVGADRYELPSPEPMTPDSQKSNDDNDVNESLYEYFSEEDEDDTAEKRIAKSAVGRIPSLKDIPLPDAWREKRTMAFRMTDEPGKYQFGNMHGSLCKKVIQCFFSILKVEQVVCKIVFSQRPDRQLCIVRAIFNQKYFNYAVFHNLQGLVQ